MWAFLRFAPGWLFPKKALYDNWYYRRPAGSPGGLVGVHRSHILRGLVRLLLAGPTGSWAQAPSFTQAVSLNVTAANGASEGQAIALDAAGNQCSSGNFSETLVLGTTTLVAAGFYDVFVAKRSASTSAWLWAVQIGGSSTGRGYAIAADAAGNVLVTCFFLYSASFATSPAPTILTSAGDSDIFVAKFEASTGAALRAVRAGGRTYDYGTGITAAAAGNAVVTGLFFSRILVGSQTLTGNGTTAFIARLGGRALGAAVATAAAPPVVFSNPAQGHFTLALPPVPAATPATATVVNALGQVVSTRTLRLLAIDTTVEYATSSLAPGLYTLRVQAGEAAAAVRVAVQ